MIYLKIYGRIGNQLFMYAMARTIQYLTGDKQEIIIDDRGNCAHDDNSNYYENSLINYPLYKVTYVHDDSLLLRYFKKQIFIKRIIDRIEYGKSPREIGNYEVKYQKWFNLGGVFKVNDEFVDYPSKFPKNLYIEGYFQSERYFLPVRDEIKKIFRLEEILKDYNYPNYNKILNSNTVCISIKVQHNIDSIEYNVCDKGYYDKAIKYILEHVDNPLFFICSDNVNYVKEHFLDETKYDIIEQDASAPVHISLAVMARCKHFIIGNTSFGWWAQYLGEDPNKIVIAPHQWYGIDRPCHIYQDNWVKIEGY